MPNQTKISLKNLSNPIIIKQNIYLDKRGYFQEIFKKNLI